jgi:uncharacterized protein (DUF305 family)
MRPLFFFLLLVVFFSACTHRPVQQDLPRSQGNSVDHSGRHNSTVESSPNAASAPYELQFLDTMIAQHGAVIDMAQLAQTRAGSDQVKTAANDTIADQRRELAEFRGLRDKFYAGSPQAINLELPGAADAFDAIDLEKLDDLKEKPFDIEFVRELDATFRASKVLAKPLATQNSQASDDTEITVSVRQLAQRLVEKRDQDMERLSRLITR